MRFWVHDSQRLRQRPRLACPRISGFLVGVCIVVTLNGVQVSGRQPQTASPTFPDPRALFDQYCLTCHNQTLRTAGLELDRLELQTDLPG